MATVEPAPADVRAEHQAAVAQLEACRARVRELNRTVATERWELIDQKRSLTYLRPDGTATTREDRGAFGVIVSQDVTGSRVVPVDVDPLAALEVKLELPAATVALRRAEIAEARLRPAVEALDAEERRQAKLKLLPAVAKAYERLDAALAKAAALRGAVIEAITAVGAVSPVDATMAVGFDWPELGLLDLRRQHVRAWTAQDGS